MVYYMIRDGLHGEEVDYSHKNLPTLRCPSMCVYRQNESQILRGHFHPTPHLNNELLRMPSLSGHIEIVISSEVFYFP